MHFLTSFRRLALLDLKNTIPINPHQSFHIQEEFLSLLIDLWMSNRDMRDRRLVKKSKHIWYQWGAVCVVFSLDV